MKLLTPGRIVLAIFTTVYMVGAVIYFSARGNAEFLGYIGAVAVLLLTVALTLKWTDLPDWLLWLLSFQMLLHILGGGVQINGDILYNYVVYPIENPADLTFLKFDQVVHMFGSVVAALLVYSFLKRKSDFMALGLFLLTVLAASGIGAMNEIIEFVAKITIPDTDVGGYYNTAVDLVVNFVGASFGAALALQFWKK